MTSKSFKIRTTAVAALEPITISATLDGETDDRDVAIRPIGISSLTLSPTIVTGGSPLAGVVNLECAPAADVIVHLSSSLPLVAQPEAAVTIPHGTVSGPFTVTTAPVTTTKKPAITAATLPDAQSKTKKFTVSP